MIPAHFLILEHFPLTPNGKVDKKALPKPNQNKKKPGSGRGARNKREEVLVDLWQTVLAIPEIRIDDNFFALGGDSIKAIQIAARLLQQQWQLLVKDLFRFPTIIQLAPHLHPVKRKALQSEISGEVLLTPIQHWFFEQHQEENHHFNQSLLLTRKQPIVIDALQLACERLVEHHDALRLTFQQVKDTIQQRNEGTEQKSGLQVFDLRSHSAEQQKFEEIAQKIQRSFQLEQAPLIRFALFRLKKEDHLLVVAHHLVIDGVSWRILLEDLERGYQQALTGTTVLLPLKTDSYREWSHALREHNQTSQFQREKTYWLECNQRQIDSAAPFEPAASGSYGDVEQVAISLPSSLTTALQQEANQAYNTEINDLLLVALALTFKKRKQRDQTWLLLEGHGREALYKELDLNRTIGWFTSLFPFCLTSREDHLSDQIKQTKEDLRQVPAKGFGYGIFHYLNPEDHSLAPLPNISFNYLGEFQESDENEGFCFVDGVMGDPVSPHLPNPFSWMISGMIIRGSLKLSVSFHPQQWPMEEMREFMRVYLEELEGVIIHCRKPLIAEKTPSDFSVPLFDLKGYQALLQQLPWQAKEIQDIYPLSPMQKGMLFQHLLEPESVAYFLQMDYRLEGPLERTHFKESWQEITRRHGILRTSFIHEGLPDPLQVVLKERSPQFIFEDLRSLSKGEQQHRITAVKQQEKEKGFDLQREPLLRIHLYQLGDQAYQTLWNYHHLLLDGWCLGQIFQEFAQIYSNLSSGKELQLDVPLPYGEYIRWLSQRDASKATSFWKKYLTELEGETQIPGGYETSLSTDYQHQMQVLELDQALSQALRSLASQLGITLNIVIQGVWGILLSRYTRSEDVLFGTVVSGRPADLPGVEQMVGLFINSVPVRFQTSHDSPLSTVLQQLQKETLEAEDYHFLPLAEISHQSPHGGELFNHLLIFENYPEPPKQIQGNSDTEESLHVEHLDVHDRTHYDLDVTIVPQESLRVIFSFNAAVYPEAMIQRMRGHFQEIAHHLTQNPEQSIGQINLLRPEEKKQIIAGFSQHPKNYPKHSSWLDLFQEQVSENSEKIALCYQGSQLTYQELDQQSNQLAHFLIQEGVQQETNVGICLGRSLNLIVGVLGILKAGGAYVPLDPGYPKDRLAFMLEDSQVSLLVTESSQQEQLPPHRVKNILLDQDKAQIAAQPKDLPLLGSLAESPAHMIYTSGSTGRPKGVLVEHKSLLNAAYAWHEAYQLDQLTLNILQMASVSFDVFAGDLIRCFCNGGTMILCPDEVRLEADLLYHLLQEHRIDFFESTPGVILPLMNHLREQKLNLPFLKILVLGSDSLAAEDYRALVRDFGEQMRILNSYGVTEATVDSSFFEDTQFQRQGDTNTPIGKPLGNINCYILDLWGNPTPIGVPGELYLGGISVARGYWNRPDLTQERFVNNPLIPGERCYKTGDLASWLEDGNLMFWGRFDDQVKIRGYRIELKEIENLLLKQESIKQAVVLARGKVAKEIVAFIVPQVGWELSKTRELLQQILPDYMVPGIFVTIDQVPLTPNGKVNKVTLLKQAKGNIARSHQYQAPRNLREQKLAAIWQKVLQVDQVGIQDNFFELGGHSLKAMQVSARIQQELGIKISLRDIFDSQTLQDLALKFSSSQQEQLQQIPIAPLQEDYELSSAQKRLWLQHHLAGEVAYNMPEVHVWSQKPDSVALQKAFKVLLERHEALRTSFVILEDEPRQKILPVMNFSIEEFDLTSSLQAEEEAESIATRAINSPFDLSKPPLLRALLLHVNEQKHVFVLILHHIIGDGWSGNVLYREILALYGAFLKGEENPLNPLRIQYKDFSHWQNHQSFQQEEKYWLRQLAGVPEQLTLTYDFSLSEERSFQGNYQTLRFSEQVTSLLRQYAQQRKTSLSNLILALLQMLLFQKTGQEDFCVGLSIANRNHPDLENLIGFFVNLLPIRSQLSETMDFDQLLSQTMESTQEAFEHQDYPFDRLIEKLNPQRQSNRQPLINVVYAFQNFSDVHIELDENSSQLLTENPTETQETDNDELETKFETSKFDLTFFVTDQGTELLLELEYDSTLFSVPTIKGYLNSLHQFAQLLTNQLLERRN